MDERWEWANKPTVFATLREAALEVAELMAAPSQTAVQLTGQQVGRFNRVDLQQRPDGWNVQYTDRQSFVRFLRRVDADPPTS